MSELYHANGAANGYDPLGQLTAFARGTLSDANALTTLSGQPRRE
jgi:hypothetical protein